MSRSKDPATAATLSLLWPGLGQLYNGRIDMGVAMGAFQAVNLGLILTFPASALLLGVVPAWLYWVDVPVVLLWSATEAHRTARGIGASRTRR